MYFQQNILNYNMWYTLYKVLYNLVGILLYIVCGAASQISRWYESFNI